MSSVVENIRLGDLIQYRFKRGGIVAGRNVAEVVGFELDENGKRIYVVKGGFWVKKKDVLAVIPKQESGAGSPEPAGSEAITREFPLEAGE